MTCPLSFLFFPIRDMVACVILSIRCERDDSHSMPSQSRRQGSVKVRHDTPHHPLSACTSVRNPVLWCLFGGDAANNREVTCVNVVRLCSLVVNVSDTASDTVHVRDKLSPPKEGVTLSKDPADGTADQRTGRDQQPETD